MNWAQLSRGCCRSLCRPLSALRCWDSTNTTQIVAGKWGGTEGRDGLHIPRLDVPRQDSHTGQSKTTSLLQQGALGHFTQDCFKSKSHHKSSARKDGKCADTQQPSQPKRCLRVAARICHYLTLQPAFPSLLFSSEWGEKDLQCREKWD